MRFIKLHEVPPNKKGELYWSSFAAYDQEAKRQFPNTSLYMRTLDSTPDFLEMTVFTPVPDTAPALPPQNPLSLAEEADPLRTGMIVPTEEQREAMLEEQPNSIEYQTES